MLNTKNSIKVKDATIEDNTITAETIITFKLDTTEMDKFRRQADETKSGTLDDFIEQILNKAFYGTTMKKYNCS